MSSSDSGEDFESADEDLDLNESNKSYSGRDSSVNSSDKPPSIPLQELKNLKLADSPIGNRIDDVDEVGLPTVKGARKNSNDTETEASHSKDSKTQTSFEDRVHLISSEETRDSLLTLRLSDSLQSDTLSKEFKSDSDDTLDKLSAGRITKSEDVEMKHTKSEELLDQPNVNAGDGDGWEIEQEENIDDSSCDDLNQSDGLELEENKVEVSSPLNLSKTLTPESNEIIDVRVKNSSLPEVETNPQDGWDNDDWEIEEDGFEIPPPLEKSSDGSIPCAQDEKQFRLTDQVECKPANHQQDQSWGGWGGWGVGSLLSTATGSVSTFSSQVTSGLSTVLESAVGAPDPETLAATSFKKDNEAAQLEENPLNEEDKTPSSFSGFGSIVSGVSFLGSSVINRGLDTLETLGKKTMEVLQEGDPGLKKKRAMLFPNQDKPVLSQILREAKEKADNSDKEKEEKETARKVHFESLFDDFHGMVHLEALEMLSTQCGLKLQSMLLSQSGDQLEDLQETMAQVRDLCELTEDDEDTEALSPQQFTERVTKCVKGLNVNITAVKIVKVNNEVINRLCELSSEPAPEMNEAGFSSMEEFTAAAMEWCKLSSKTADVINEAAISSLAEFTAAGMECFHKSAELLLAKPLRNTPDEAENYVQLTNHLCARVSAMANEFTQLLTKNHPIANSSIITNIFLEASNSCSYMKNACQLLVPILQVGAVCS